MDVLGKNSKKIPGLNIVEIISAIKSTSDPDAVSEKQILNKILTNRRKYKTEIEEKVKAIL